MGCLSLIQPLLDLGSRVSLFLGNLAEVKEGLRGEKTLYYYSKDKSGNKEATSTFSFYLDATPPLTNCGIEGWIVEENPLVELDAVDTGAGVEKTFYRLEKAEGDTFLLIEEGEGNEVSIEEDGIYRLTYHSRDVLNNEEEEKETKFGILSPAKPPAEDAVAEIIPSKVGVNQVREFTYYILSSQAQGFEKVILEIPQGFSNFQLNEVKIDDSPIMEGDSPDTPLLKPGLPQVYEWSLNDTGLLLQFDRLLSDTHLIELKFTLTTPSISTRKYFPSRLNNSLTGNETLSREGDAIPSSGENTYSVLVTGGEGEEEEEEKEIGDEEEAGKALCCILALLFSRSHEEETEALRRFRDRHLLTSVPGRWIVKGYYWLSAKTVPIIRRHRFLFLLGRWSLRPVMELVRMINSIRPPPSNPISFREVMNEKVRLDNCWCNSHLPSYPPSPASSHYQKTCNTGRKDSLLQKEILRLSYLTTERKRLLAKSLRNNCPCGNCS